MTEPRLEFIGKVDGTYQVLLANEHAQTVEAHFPAYEPAVAHIIKLMRAAGLVGGLAPEIPDGPGNPKTHQECYDAAWYYLQEGRRRADEERESKVEYLARSIYGDWAETQKNIGNPKSWDEAHDSVRVVFRGHALSALKHTRQLP